MLKSVFYPNKTNSFAWFNVLFLVLLVAIGKIEAYAVLFGYFLETIVIGFFNALKMYYTYKYNDKQAKIKYQIFFFCMHYGLFVAVQSVFLFAIFSFSKNSFVQEPFYILQNFKNVLQLKGMPLILMVILISQLLKFIFDFLVPKKYNLFKVKEIMFMPYFRIFIQQLVVILGSLFIVFSNGSVLAAILLIILRALVDFFLVAIKQNSKLLDYVATKYSTKEVSIDAVKKQLLLFTE